MPETDFAQRLQQLREKAGLSQYELARRAGVTRQTLSRLEMGESVPSWPTVQVLAAALGVDCTAFNDPGIQLPPEQPAAPRGRPRKAEGLEPAPASGKGKTGQAGARKKRSKPS